MSRGKLNDFGNVIKFFKEIRNSNMTLEEAKKKKKEKKENKLNKNEKQKKSLNQKTKKYYKMKVAQNIELLYNARKKRYQIM